MILTLMNIERLFLRRLNIYPKLVYLHSDSSKEVIRSAQSDCFKKILKEKNPWCTLSKILVLNYKPATRFPIEENI